MPQNVVRALEEFVGEVVKRIVTEVTAAEIEASPVDTGFFRANWIPTIGMPFDGTDGERARGGISQSAQNSGIIDITTRYTIDQGPAYITNNVEYGLVLNAGRSTQAPSGFVQIAIDLGLQRAVAAF